MKQSGIHCWVLSLPNQLLPMGVHLLFLLTTPLWVGPSLPLSCACYIFWLVSLPSRSSHIQFTLPRALHCVYIYIQEHSNHNPSPTLCLYYSAYSRPSRETNLSVGKSFKSGGWTVQHGHCYSRVERVPEVSEAVICELRGWTNWECPNWCSAAHRYAKVENTTLLWKNF